MAIVGSGRRTFLYINGIQPREMISLGDGVSFEASICKPEPSAIIAACKSEIDMGVACVYLRSVRSYFKVVAKNPRKLAIRAWNAQWDAVLLNALFNCEAAIHFQADRIPEEFSASTKLNIPHYHLHIGSLRQTRVLTIAEHKWIKKHYRHAKLLMDVEKYRNAVHCVSSYRWHASPRVQLAVLWSGIEGLFGVGYELSFRISLYVSRYLSPNRKAVRRKIFEDIKKLYSLRSKAIHGSSIKKLGDSVSQTALILRRLISKCAEHNELPDISNLAP